jgi:hypothetical protein
MQHGITIGKIIHHPSKDNRAINRGLLYGEILLIHRLEELEYENIVK